MDKMQIDITSMLFLVAAVQAVILILVILRKRKLLFSEKYLIAVLVTILVTLLHYVVIINQLISWGSVFMDLSAISWFAVSPLLYLYCRSLVQKEATWNWRQLWYFPFSIYLTVQIGLSLAGSRIGFYLLFTDGNTYTLFWILAYLVNSLVFSLLSIRVLKKANLSERHQVRLKWIFRYFYTFSITTAALSGLLLYWLNARLFIQEFEFFLLLLYAVFIFSLIILSLRFSPYFNQLSNDHYAHDQKNKEELAQIYGRLKHTLEQKQPYLNPSLSLTDLSKVSEIPENQLSQVFNQYLDSNFYRFVNKYRLQEFERQVSTKGTQQYTIMAIAESSGFHSKATFYKVFKEHYGTTPADFIKKRGKAKEN